MMAKKKPIATPGGMQIAVLCPLGADLLRNRLPTIVRHWPEIPKQILLDLSSHWNQLRRDATGSAHVPDVLYQPPRI